MQMEIGGEALQNLKTMAADQNIGLDEMIGRVIEISWQLWCDARRRPGIQSPMPGGPYG